MTELVLSIPNRAARLGVMEEMKAFGALILEGRRRKGMQAKDLAPLLGIGQSTLSNFENGMPKTPPSPEFADRVSRVLDIPKTEIAIALGYLDRGDLEQSVSPEVAGLLPYLESVEWTAVELEREKAQLRWLAEHYPKRKDGG